MSQSAHLTFDQIASNVIRKLRLPTDGSQNLQISDLINEVYRDIAAKQDWWWLMKHHATNTTTFDTFPNVSTQATITVATDGLTGLLDSSTLPTPGLDLTNWAMIFPGLSSDSEAVFRVQSYDSNLNTITFDEPFTAEDTSLLSPNSITMNIYKDNYILPNDCGKVLNVMRFGRLQPMGRIGIEDMSRLKLYDQTVGKPEVYSVYDFYSPGDPLSRRHLIIHPYPDHQYRMMIYYKQHLNTQLSGNTEPFIPDDYRQILVYGALSRGYPIFLNDTERGAYYLALFNDVMALMSAQQKEYAKDNSGIAPDMSSYRAPNRRPRTAFTLGSWFDRLPNQP